MVVRLYSARQITSVTRFTLEQLEYLCDIALVVPSLPSDEAEQARYDDVNLLRLQQIRVGRARRLALEEIRRWLEREDCALPLESLQRHIQQHRTLFLQTEAKVETDEERRAFQTEASQLYAALSCCRDSGVLPGAAALSHWAERHRFHIERWFCPCTEPEHLAFGRGIASNAYLSAQIEQHGAQLTSFMLSVLRARTPLQQSVG